MVLSKITTLAFLFIPFETNGTNVIEITLNGTTFDLLKVQTQGLTEDRFFLYFNDPWR